MPAGRQARRGKDARPLLPEALRRSTGRHDAREVRGLYCEGHMEPRQGQAARLKPQSVEGGEEGAGGRSQPPGVGVAALHATQRAVGEEPAEEITGHLRQGP